MIVQTITYIDYNGIERNEHRYFKMKKSDRRPGKMEPFEKFEKDIKRMVDEYKISEGHAACYLCNWEDTYICHTHNGGCSFGLKCHSICESEKQKGE